MKYYLHNNWKCKIDKDSYSALTNKKIIKSTQLIDANVPGTIHTDLLKAKIIPDPFYADNELKLKWINESDWIYQTIFDFPNDFKKDEHVYLHFNGLDTIAEINLNNKPIAKTDNMFIQYEFDITGMLNKKKNKLEIKFISALKYGHLLKEKNGHLPASLNHERVYIRKAQYSFGWDWGPSFATCGIYRSVYLLQKPKINITNLNFDTISITDNKAVVKIKVEIQNPEKSACLIKIKMAGNSKQYEKSINNSDSCWITTEMEIDDPKLWSPHNYGEQYLYELSVQAIAGGENQINVVKKRVGIRTLNLILENQGKPSFHFVVNGRPIFIKGANWIPGDSFLPRVSDEKYLQLLKSAKNANMNMIRVWGGGVYENDRFYEICDELGLLVWQDFMFACASYPENDDFIKNVTEEIKQNVYRLQTHPSIAIWCGNNENEWSWYQDNKTDYKEMSGYDIYHKIIPSILREADPGRAYWESSPFGNEADPNSELSGNRHQWQIWSGWMDYTTVKNDNSLFVTEFGFQSPANYNTFANVLPKDELYSQSRVFEFHNKQVEGPERLFKFLSAHLPVKTKLTDFIYLTQLNQGLALKYSLEHWQSRFPETTGTIIWQLNDCWPVSSWSLIDSGIQPKLSYFMVRNSFSPVLSNFVQDGKSLKVIVQNNSLDEFRGELHVKYISLPKGKIENIKIKKLKIKPMYKNSVISLMLPEDILDGKTVIISSLYNKKNKLLHRNFYKNYEWKHIKMPKAKIEYDFKKHNQTLVVKADTPVFFLYFESPDLQFEDNGIIILPGEKMSLKVQLLNKKFNKKTLTYHSLNQYLEG